MKPILFNTEMVRAILEGRKTVTRRVIKLPEGMGGRPIGSSYDNNDPAGFFYPCGIKRAPYMINDVLYVRETWREYITALGEKKRYEYRASCPDIIDFLFKWKPSIHMPKEAARLFLRVTDVRVEKLRDMKLMDILAEGITLDRNELRDPNIALVTAREKFSELWDSTAGKRGTPEYYAHNWYGNPFVWVIEFEVISKEEAMKEL